MLTSIALSRLDNALREAYIANAAIKFNDLSILQALGFQYIPGETTVYPLLGDKVGSLVQTFLTNVVSDYDKTIHPESAIVANYVGFIGVYREDTKNAVQAWDTDAAGFVGKYYSFVNPVPMNRFDCPFADDWFIYYTYDSRWETLPQSKFYGGDAVPFASILKDPVSNVNYSKIRRSAIFSVDDNVWGIEPNVYEAQRGSSNYDYLKPLIFPINEQPVLRDSLFAAMSNGLVKNMMAQEIQQQLLVNQSKDNGSIIAVILIPVLSKFSSAPAISAVGRMVNHFAYSRATTHSSTDDKAAKCSTYCDSNIVSEICNCGSQYTPKPYFHDLMAPFIQIKHSNGNVSNVVFPVDSNYFGYFCQNR